jgi:F-box-like
MNPSQFPVEIISLILEFLTPGSLISVSQTCRYFRSIVAPEPFHFAQRLLVFELLPEFGGAIPILRFHRKSFIIPHLEDVESWDAIRYACTGCLRIRHHRWFDNHSIFRLRMRKPYLNSPVANALC